LPFEPIFFRMNIYAGNLNYTLTEEALEKVFTEYGEVTSVKIIRDKYTDQSKGFGFIEMADDAAAQKAIDELNGTEVNGRELRVNQARPPREQ
jgi:RNA recognition motif-containing protein